MKKSIALFISTLALSACSVVNSQAVNAEAAQEYRAIVAKAQRSQAIDNTSQTAKRIQTVFNQMRPYANAANQTGQTFDWEMVVIRSDELNAWAMPAGKMAVYTGIVEKLNLNDNEIAAVVGHEMAHALLEHTKKESNRNIGLGILTQLGSSALAAYTGINADLVGLGVGLASDLGVQKPFSRSAEREADANGLKLMAQAGYNPNAAVTVWQKMNAQENNNTTFNKIVSTHPTNNARITAIQNELPKVMPLYQRAIGNTIR